MGYTSGPGDHRIHFVEHGAAADPTLVMIQGLGLDGRFWFDLPDRLARDPDQPWRVLVPDNRGVGKSGSPKRAWTMRQMADDIVAMLDAAGVERATLVGISMGGMIAQQVALRHPDRVEGLILMATWPGLPFGRLPHFRTLGDLLSASLLQRKEIEPIARILLPESEIPRAKEHLGGWFQLMRDHRPSRGTFLRQLGAITTHSTGHRLEDIVAPTRVITGDEDRLVPPHNSQVLARRIPNAQLEILPGVGHAIPLIDKSVVMRNLAALRSLETRDRARVS